MAQADVLRVMEKGKTYTAEELIRQTGLCEGTLRKNLQSLRSNGDIEFVPVEPTNRARYGLGKKELTRTVYRLRA